MAQRLGHCCFDQQQEAFALELEAVIECHAHCGGHRLDAFERGRIVFGGGTHGVARKLEKGLVMRVVDDDVAHALERQLVGDGLVREGDGPGQQVLQPGAFYHLVE